VLSTSAPIARSGAATRSHVRSAAIARAAARAGQALGEHPSVFEGSPILSVEAGDESFPLPDSQWVRVEIPADIQGVKQQNPDLAAAWRRSTRRAFLHYFARGYRVTTYLRDGNRRFYGLSTR
jgi:hypothetical protein